MLLKKGRGRGRATVEGKVYAKVTAAHRGMTVEAGTAGVVTMTTIHTMAGKAKDGTAGHAQLGRKAEIGETRDQLFDRLMWEDSSSHTRSEKEELANHVVIISKVRTDLGIEDEDSSRSHDEGGVDHGDGGHDIVSKSLKVEKQRLHKQKLI